MNLDRVMMYVSSTADQGVVGPGTRLRLMQKGSKVRGRCGGVAVSRDCLVGTLSGSQLVFRYAQAEASSEIHGGRSVC